MDFAWLLIEFEKFLFWSALLCLVVPVIIYPISLVVISRSRKAPIAPANSTPSVSLIISAFNEEAVIGEKLLNSLQLEYPAGLLEILVISDASTDATNEIVASYADRGIRLCNQDTRRGKSAGLTRFCPDCRGEILVFTDANSMFRKDALQKLVRHFSDPSIGYSVGRQLYLNAENSSSKSERTYWSFEQFMKMHESRLSSVVGADGAIYAMRKSLFEPLADDDISDFVLPLKMIVKGKRGIYDPEAVCYENSSPNYASEFRRKYRIVNRSLRAVLRTPEALNPFRVGVFAYQLICHKLLRWLSPIFLLVALISSAILVAQGERLYTVFLAMQLGIAALAALYLFPALRKTRLVYLAFYYLVVNCAAIVGIYLTLRSKTIATWEPQR